tara:strand:- start:4862 stop:5152 length:291 start_codon:yes stop_codon:yes gene_type:complete
MDYDLDKNLNPEYFNELAIKIRTIEVCINIINSERKDKIEALHDIAKNDEVVRHTTLSHYEDSINIFVESLIKLLRALIKDLDDSKRDDSSPDLTN